MNCQHLIRLADGWRSKAASLKARYHTASPNLVDHVVMALETCAQELEDEVHASIAQPSTPPLSTPPLSTLT